MKVKFQVIEKFAFIAFVVLSLSGLTVWSLFFFPHNFTRINTFERLSLLSAYAKKLNEYPIRENDNALNPEFSKFHKKGVPNFARHLLNSAMHILGFSAQGWTAPYFRDLLHHVARAREVQERRGSFIEAFTPAPGDKFVMWGDIQGSFHSMVRDLQKLQAEGIIDDNLKIKQGTYFVFNGDLVDRSPHILETLTLTLQLMAVNPLQVFYIRGNHEDDNLWYNYGTRRELELRAHYISRAQPPLGALLKRFFLTLPLGLFLRMSGSDEPQYVGISHLYIEDDRLDDHYFSDFLFSMQSPTAQIFYPDHKIPSTKSVDVKAIMRAESRSTQFDLTEGLDMKESVKGATTWTMLSSPNGTYQEIYQFFDDAFAIVDVGTTQYDWTIELYNRDVRKQEAFKKTKYNFVSGHPITSETADTPPWKELMVGCSLDLSHSSIVLGKRLMEGLSLKINSANSTLVNELIRIVFLDDGYTPSSTRQNIEIFLKKYNTSIILSSLGTPTLEALLDDIKTNRIAVFFPCTGAQIFREPSLHSIIHYRTSYAREAEALVDYAVNVKLLRKFAIFYQDDSYGKSPLEAARASFKKYGITNWLETSYTRNTIAVEDSIKKISDYSPDAILFFSTYAPSATLIHKLNLQTLSKQTLLGISFLTDIFRVLLKELGLSCVLSQVVPNPRTSPLPIVEKYRKEAMAHFSGQGLNADALEGYINATLFIDACTHITRPLNKEKLISYFEGLKGYTIDGLTLNFNPQTRELCDDVWIDAGEEWIHKKDINRSTEKAAPIAPLPTSSP